MKIIFFGLGSMGKRHAGLIQDNSDHQLYALRSGYGGDIRDLEITELKNWDEVDSINADVAFITNPPGLHIATAIECAKRGMHLFIEKPLGAEMEGLDELKSICREKNLTCYVAYCMRFHPVINKIREIIRREEVLHVRATCSSYLPEWRSVSNWRRISGGPVNLGGGVILDLSHEFDSIEYIFSHISSINGHWGRVGTDEKGPEDYADISMTLDNGIGVNLYLNFMSRVVERRLIVDLKDGYVEADVNMNKIVFAKNGEQEIFELEYVDIFLEQLNYFFANIGIGNIMNNLDDATVLFRKIVAIKEKAL